MNRMKFSYFKLMAVVAVLAMTLLPSIRTSTAKDQPLSVAAVAPGADLANEERVIGKYFDDLVAYQQECFQLKKRQALRNADLDPLQRKSEDLKDRLSEVQNAVREVVRKLKAANEWDDLDATLLANTTDANRRAFFQESSFKADLEDTAATLAGKKNDISLPLDNLRKRIARETLAPYADGVVAFVAAGYGPLTPMGDYSLGCRLGQVRLKIITKLGGHMNTATCDAVSCACKPNGGGLCSGASCPGAGASN